MKEKPNVDKMWQILNNEWGITHKAIKTGTIEKRQNGKTKLMEKPIADKLIIDRQMKAYGE